jgi:carbonic anhydrase/acetyltransferase-like protein (isoleucine patch superfamily)
VKTAYYTGRFAGSCVAIVKNDVATICVHLNAYQKQQIKKEIKKDFPSVMCIEGFQLFLVEDIRRLNDGPLEIKSFAFAKTQYFQFPGTPAPVAAHCHINGSGWVADTAEVDDACFVSIDSYVYDGARVTGACRISRNSRVFGCAHISDHAEVNASTVYENAVVCDYAHISESYVHERAVISGYGLVASRSRVYGQAKVRDNACIRDGALFGGTSIAELYQVFTMRTQQKKLNPWIENYKKVMGLT